ncbi:MAG TPA: 2'-5' RNA ligase family protein [Caldilineae bacterium]|nr:2'-5' RNA ligase family protein [Caldilineae bacterium]
MIESIDNRLYIIGKPPEPTRSVLRDLFVRLAQEAGGTPNPEPRLTIQAIYGLHLAEVVQERVETVVRDLPPIHVRASGLIAFALRTPHQRLVIPVEKTPALRYIYQVIAEEVESLGVPTQPFDLETWQPHMTAVEGDWEDAEAVARQLAPQVPEIQFLIDRLWMSVLRAPGTWMELGIWPLRGRLPDEHPDRGT